MRSITRRAMCAGPASKTTPVGLATARCQLARLASARRTRGCRSEQKRASEPDRGGSRAAANAANCGACRAWKELMRLSAFFSRAVWTVILPLFAIGCVVERCEWTSEVTPTASDRDAETSVEAAAEVP